MSETPATDPFHGRSFWGWGRDADALDEAKRRHGAQACLTKKEPKEALIALVRELLGES